MGRWGEREVRGGVREEDDGGVVLGVWGRGVFVGGGGGGGWGGGGCGGGGGGGGRGGGGVWGGGQWNGGWGVGVGTPGGGLDRRSGKPPVGAFEHVERNAGQAEIGPGVPKFLSSRR